MARDRELWSTLVERMLQGPSQIFGLRVSVVGSLHCLLSRSKSVIQREISTCLVKKAVSKRTKSPYGSSSSEPRDGPTRDTDNQCGGSRGLRRWSSPADTGGALSGRGGAGAVIGVRWVPCLDGLRGPKRGLRRRRPLGGAIEHPGKRSGVVPALR